jgi:antirestriction protein ArdC
MVPFCFSVFAVEQVDGWTPPEIPVRSPLERDQIVEAFFTAVGADVRHEGNRAYYSPTKDAIVLPEMDRFDKVADYYATSAHEHAHWTGHSSRLGRDLSGRFGSDSYAMEELCAELSAAFTCAALHLSPTPRPDHAAYLASWLRVLKADHSAIFHVASRAQAATDYLTSASVASVVAA